MKSGTNTDILAISHLRQARGFADMLAVPCFIIAFNADDGCYFEYLNKAHFDVIGIQPEALIGKTPHECFPVRVADTLVKNYQHCRTSKQPYAYEELLDLAGEEKWAHTTLSPIFDDETGDVIGIIGIGVDITESKMRELRQTESESALRKLNEEIALFTSMTAHDVRGPLTKIESLSDLTLDGFADLGDNKRDMILTMQRIARGSLKHIDGILSYAVALRLGAAEASMIDLDHVCSDIAALVDPQARLAIVLPRAFINGEIAVLQIILRNLAENAARHAKSQLSITVVQGGEGRLTFSVADDGPGFEGGAGSLCAKDEAASGHQH